MIAVHADDLLRNEQLDALVLSYAEARPSNDGMSDETVCKVVRDLAFAWWEVCAADEVFE